MKALAITSPGNTAFIDVAEPALQDGDVLIEVKRVGFCGTDLNSFRGTNPNVAYPRIPGHEIAGVVVAAGGGVPHTLRSGTIVTVLPYKPCGDCPACRGGRPNTCRNNQTLGVQCDGAMTGLIRTPWQNVIRSEKLGLAEHALIEPLSIGFHAVGRGRIVAEDTVMVLGCGMIGLGVITGAALLRGARVIAVDIDDNKLGLARKAGAVGTINSRTSPLHERLLELTNGDGPGVVVEAIGTPATFRAAVDEVSVAGRVVYIGYAKDAVSYETKQFVLKELDILGSRNATRRDFEEVIGVLESGKYPVRETITSVVPFESSGDALAGWAADPSRVTKIHVEM